MRSLTVARVAAMLLAACTPCLVASIALRVAAAQAGAPALRVHSMTLLRAMTPAVAIAAALATVLITPSPWLLLVAGLAFGAPAIVGLKALAEIDDATRSIRQVNIAERAASLKPRKAGEYLPWSWRLAACGATVLGVAAVVVRASGGTGRRMLVPVAFAAAALIFLWLYEVWTHQVITGPTVAGDTRDLRRIVRRIFGMELLLVVVCLATAHALLNLDADGMLRTAISVGASAVAVVGCALTLSSGLMGRRYDTV